MSDPDCESCSKYCDIGVSKCRDNNCTICGTDCEYEYHECDCGKIVCLECAPACDTCGKRHCKQCWELMKTENPNCGIEVDDTFSNLCLECKEKENE
jgi:hypothetical protein